MADTVTIILTTLPNAETAEALTQKVLDARLAACVTQLAPARSRYVWQGKLEDVCEIPLLFKTTTAHTQALSNLIAEQHPYQTPEILTWTASAAPAYAQWVMAQT